MLAEDSWRRTSSDVRETHIPLNLLDRGEGAQSVVEVALTAQQRIANNSEVLSEGEQRALALACFLAELSEIGSDHGIIVDDPVSSLDHTRMQAVAERLAGEAANGRQVVLFTLSYQEQIKMVAGPGFEPLKSAPLLAFSDLNNRETARR